MRPSRSRRGFNDEEEAFIERISNYSFAFETSAARLRQTCSPDQLKFAHSRAQAEWDNRANGYPGQFLPKVGTPEWHTMWNTLNAVITSTPRSDKDLALKGIAGIYAMSALIEHELAEHPLQAEIMNEAERRTLLRVPAEGGLPVTVAQPTYIGLANRDLPGLNFTITDYGSSLSNGPWVQYLPRNGVKGRDELTVTGDQMEAMLENRK